MKYEYFHDTCEYFHDETIGKWYLKRSEKPVTDLFGYATVSDMQGRKVDRTEMYR